MFLMSQNVIRENRNCKNKKSLFPNQEKAFIIKVSEILSYFLAKYSFTLSEGMISSLKV